MIEERTYTVRLTCVNSKAEKEDMCQKCGKCGRKFRKGILVDNSDYEWIQHMEDAKRKESE